MARSGVGPGRRVATLVAAACLGGGTVAASWVSSASAHPLDELVQQVYVTPAAANTVGIDVELAVGVEVAADFESLLDSDRDGVISDAEWAALQSAVLGDVKVRLDGDDVQPTVEHVDLPDLTALRSGDGVIVYALSISANDGQTAEGLTVHDAYAPEGPNGPIKTRVQMNVTPDLDWPIDVQSIDRAPDGREMTTSFTALDPAPSAADSGAGSTSEPGGTGPAVWQQLVLVTSVFAFVLLVVIRRARARRAVAIER